MMTQGQLDKVMKMAIGELYKWVKQATGEQLLTVYARKVASHTILLGASDTVDWGHRIRKTLKKEADRELSGRRVISEELLRRLGGAS